MDPTLQARPAMDANNDGTVSAAELALFSARTCTEAAATIALEVNGLSLPLSLGTSSGRLIPGQVGLYTSNAATRRALWSRSLLCMNPIRLYGLISSNGEADVTNEPAEAFVEQKVTYSLEVEGRFIVIEQVPARVSLRTGERFFAPETVERL